VRADGAAAQVVVDDLFPVKQTSFNPPRFEPAFVKSRSSACGRWSVVVVVVVVR
jgi:hypothetical protein